MCTIKIKDSQEDITTQLYTQIKIIQALYYKPWASRARIQARYTSESAEATISEYRHKLNKFCLKKASTKVATIEEGRPPAWDLLTTPGRRQRAARSSRHLPSSSSSHRRWRLAPGLQRLVAAIGYRKGEKREQSNREYSSKVLASKELHYICMHWYQME